MSVALTWCFCRFSVLYWAGCLAFRRRVQRRVCLTREGSDFTTLLLAGLDGNWN